MSKAEWVEAWLKRKTGKEFLAKDREWYLLLRNEITAGLRDIDKEGLGTCDCGGSEHAITDDYAFYMGTDRFMRICGGCDSWAIYPRSPARMKTK